MRYLHVIAKLLRERRGATLMEFGLVAPVLMMLLLGTVDLGYQGYLDTLSKSKLHEVARAASTGTMSTTKIEQQVRDGLDNILLDEAVVQVEVKSYYDFTNIGKPEKITKDINGDGDLDVGDCYLDGNDNGVFDIDTGESGLGGPDDIVSYTITISSPRLFPIAEWFGGSNRMVSTNSTAVRNQPYGEQVEDIELCET